MPYARRVALHREGSVFVEVPRQHVVDVLQRAGLGQEAEAIASSLPDPVDIDRAEQLLLPYGITLDELISRRGGSP
jgi:hypothetical protein